MRCAVGRLSFERTRLLRCIEGGTNLSDPTSSSPTPLSAAVRDLFRPRIRLKHLVLFLRRSATAMNAGIDVRAFWEMEARRAPARYQDAFQAIYQQVSAGDTLAEALEAQGDFFPVMVRELVDVGEKNRKSTRLNSSH